MLLVTSMALPLPSARRCLVAMSRRMSATIFSRRDWLDNTFCRGPPRCFNCALARSFRPLGFGPNGVHGLVQFAGLGAVALVDEHIEITLGAEVRRQILAQLLDVALHIGI